jgi:hypothetical protein
MQYVGGKTPREHIQEQVEDQGLRMFLTGSEPKSIT